MHPDYDPQAPRPLGFLTRLFIHLAGADPKVFSQLPPHETSDYMKMGITVLVPFALALSAGSFTIYTIQDPKNLFYAVIFGSIWAMVILAIDVAILSQLNKRVIIQPVQQGPIPLAAARGPQAQPSRHAESSGCRNFIVATMRILIAVTLGTLMSHCLVLAVFKGRVIERILEVRAAPRAEVVKNFGAALKKADDDLNAAQVVLAENDDSIFKIKYERFKQSTAPAQSTPGAAGTTPPAPPSQDVFTTNANLQALKTTMDALDQKYAVDSTELETTIESQNSDLAKYQRDIKAAERLRELELSGKKGDAVVFDSTEFKVLGTPSGIEGKGSRTERIEAFIKDWKVKLEIMKTDISAKQEKLKTVNKVYAEAKAKQQKEIDALADLLGENVRKGLTSAAENLKSFAQKERAALEKDITDRKTQVEEARKIYNKKLEPFDTQSYDLLAQTEALHDLALGRGQEGGQEKSRTTVILAILILVMLCLMFIDLTPLLIKLMKPPTAYDEYITRMKMMPLAAWQQSAGGQAPQASPSFRQQAQPRREVPPPPPRSRGR